MKAIGEKIEEARIEKILQALTLDEKIGMIHGAGLFRTEGVERLNIPPLKMSDGPRGVRQEFHNASWLPKGLSDDFVTYLPCNSAIACTWNRDLARKVGEVLGCEARGRGKDVILAPGINIQRSPLCGRGFEYMSEDPKLVEELAVPLIEGIQENDVAACVKHFAANSQETDRLKVDTLLDERTLREIYLPGFKAAVQKAHSYTLMGAYNRLRGEHCCHSKFLLDDILRKEWGYDGTVISDWGGVHNTKEAAETSLDIEMSVTSHFDDYYMADPLKKAVQSGEIKEEFLDQKIRNILRLMLRLHMLEPERDERKSGTYNTPEHREIALQAAREAIVLLKNEEQTLPLKKKVRKIAVIGQNANKLHANGGGSSEIKALYEISPLMGIKKLLGGNVEVCYGAGYDSGEIYNIEENFSWQAEGEEKSEGHISHGKKDRELKKDQLKKEYMEEAVQLAQEADEVIFIGGLNHEYDVEGGDRTSYHLPYGQDEVIETLLEVNPNMVVVMIAGSPVEMPWAGKAKAIVWSAYAGIEGGTALAEVLFGDTNPSGKLAQTIGIHLGDYPAHRMGEFGIKGQVTFREGIFVGYRYFDTYCITPQFAFGHGLSYTHFECSSMKCKVMEGKEDLQVQITVSIKNTGDREGAETLQLYVMDLEAPLIRPVHELKEFKKVFLQPGEETQVTFTLNKEAFGFYSEEESCFKVEPGLFELQLGTSSRDIRLTQKIDLKHHYAYK